MIRELADVYIRLTGRRGAPRLSQQDAMETFERITTDAARMNGEPCIRNLRITVRRVLEALALYPDRAELKREYPEIEEEDIRQAAGACGIGPIARAQS